MSDPQHDDPLLIQGHEYDGIRELDNPLPGWWKATFYLTIVFSVAYYAYYTWLDGPESEVELQQSLGEVYHVRKNAEAMRRAADPAELEKLSKDPEALARGAVVYKDKCAMCHAPDGGGIVGPNLTDDNWIHGDGQMPGIVKVVRRGVPEKGMQPWAGMISDEAIQEVAAYVRSLRGTTPANPKEPQGDVHPDS